MTARARTGSKAAAPSRRRPRAAPLAVAGVFALKLVALWQLHAHPLLQPDAGLDTTAYIQLAREVLSGNVLLAPGLYFVSPLYIYFVALVLKVTGGSLLWVRVAQIALGTGAVALIFRTADLWHGRRAAWIAGTVAALAGLFTFYEVLILQAALDPFLTALALALLAKMATLNFFVGAFGKMLSVPVFAGVAFGVQSLNRPNVALAFAGIVTLVAITRRWRAAGLLAAGFAFALLPLAIRNYVVADDLAPVSSHGGLNFYIGNNADADGTYRMVEGITPSIVGQQEDARRVAEAAIGRSLTDPEISAHFYGRGWEWISAHPGDAAALFARKLAYVFNSAHLSLNYSYPYYARDERTLLRVLILGPWVIIPMGLLGIWLAAPREPERRRAFWIWCAFVPLYAIAVALFFVSSRYRLPILIPLCVTAGGAFDALWTLARAAPVSRRRIAIAGTALIALFIAVNWRFGLDDGHAEERTRMALWLIGQERYADAEARVLALEGEHPQPGVLHFRIGRALIAKGQPEAAIRHLEQARSKDPDRPENQYALGQALLDAGRPRDAIPHLRRAIDSGVRVDLAGYDLARSYAAVGDRARAVRTLQAVRPARADDAESWGALGKLALDLEAPRLAEAFLRQALGVRPDAAPLQEQLGLAVALSGRYAESVGIFEEAVRLDPRSASAQLNLAVAYAEVGRIAEARARAEQALRLNPSYDNAKEFLRAIAGK